MADMLAIRPKQRATQRSPHARLCTRKQKSGSCSVGPASLIPRLSVTPELDRPRFGECGHRLLVLATIEAIDRDIVGASAIDPWMSSPLEQHSRLLPCCQCCCHPNGLSSQAESPANPHPHTRAPCQRSTRSERFELPTFGSVDQIWGNVGCRSLGRFGSVAGDRVCRQSRLWSRVAWGMFALCLHFGSILPGQP